MSWRVFDFSGREFAPWHRHARRIELALPTITRKGKLVANLQLANDTIATIPILVLDAAGDVVAASPSDVFTVVSSDPASLAASIVTNAAGKTAVQLTPLVQASPGLSVTISDSAGLTAFVEGVDIVDDTTPKAIGLDLTDETTVAQPVPTNAGP